MPHHAERRPSPYSAQQLFALVDRVEDYPKFLPWCVGARVRRLTDRVMEADLILGFNGIRETFRSRVTSDPEALTIESRLVKGPFSHLENHWRFEPTDAGCVIDFKVDFVFKSRVLGAVVEPLFMTAQRRLVQAFEDRAHALYGVNREGGKGVASAKPVARALQDI